MLDLEGVSELPFGSLFATLFMHHASCLLYAFVRYLFDGCET